VPFRWADVVDIRGGPDDVVFTCDDRARSLPARQASAMPELTWD
jgi:hypothetical protein